MILINFEIFDFQYFLSKSWFFIKNHSEIIYFHQKITYFHWIFIYFHKISLDFIGFHKSLIYFCQNWSNTTLLFFFLFAWLVASQMETATIDFSFWGFSWNLVRDPLQGKPEFRTWASFWNTKALARRSWAQKRKKLQMKSQGFQSWRL